MDKLLELLNKEKKQTLVNQPNISINEDGCYNVFLNVTSDEEIKINISKGKDVTIYEYIKNQADKVIYISKQYEKECMLKRNRFMVDNSNFVTAAWDGRKRGGTYYTLNYAKKLNKQIILVDY